MQKKSARSFLKKYHKTLIIFCFLYVLTIGVALVASSHQASTWQAFKPVSGINSQVSSQMPSSTAPASSSNAPVSSSSQVLTPPDTAYQSICPQLVVPKVEEYQAPKQKTVYLTFDDGPSPVTETVLSILKEYNIKATFFVVGNSVLGNEEILKHVHEQGHSIGVHSRTHDYKQVYSSVEAFLKEYDYTNQMIKNITGEDTPIFRYPGGSNNRVSNCDIMKQIKEEMQGRGFAHFDWNCSAQDATIPLKTVDEIYNSVVYSANLQQDLVVLIHDSQNHINSAKALPAIIEYFQKNGYVFDKITVQTKPVQFSR